MQQRRQPEFFRRKRADGTLAPTLWTRIGGKRISTGTSNLKAAKRWKERKLIERADPRRAAAETATLADAMRELYAELRRRGRSFSRRICPGRHLQMVRETRSEKGSEVQDRYRVVARTAASPEVAREARDPRRARSDVGR